MSFIRLFKYLFLFSQFFVPALLLSVPPTPSIQPTTDWTPPTLLSDGDDSYEPALSINARGEAVAVWLNRTNNLSVDASFFDGSSWSACTTISKDTHGTCPKVSLSTEGNAVAVWDGYIGNRDAVFAAIKPAGKEWSDPVMLSSGPSAGGSSIAHRNETQAVAGWVNEHGDTVQISFITTDGSWSTCQTLSEAGGHKAHFQIAFDGAGKGTAIWEESATHQVFLSQSQDSHLKAWSAPRMISGSSQAANPRLGVSEAGDLIIVWSDLAKGQVYAIKLLAGAWDQTPVGLPLYSESPLADAFPGGFFIACQENSVSSSGGLIKAMRWTHGSWEDPVVLSTHEKNSPVSLAVEQKNKEALHGWTNYETGNACAARYASEGPPPEMPIILSHQGANLSPVVALSETLMGAIWRHISGTDQLIEASVTASKE